jgi:hypothetical protein
MVTGIPIEAQIMLRHSNPDYKAGYEEGFEAAKDIIAKDLKTLLKKVEELEAYTESTSTASNNF